MKCIMKLSMLFLMVQLGTLIAMDPATDPLNAEYARCVESVNTSTAAELDGLYLYILGKIESCIRQDLREYQDKYIAQLYAVKKKQGEREEFTEEDNQRMNAAIAEREAEKDAKAEAEKERKAKVAKDEEEAENARIHIYQAIALCIASDATMTYAKQRELAAVLVRELPKTGKNAETVRQEEGRKVLEAEQLQRFEKLKVVFDCGGNLPADFPVDKVKETKTEKRTLTYKAVLARIGIVAGVVALIAFGYKFLYPRFKGAGKKPVAPRAKA